jgi:two-component system, chemotaxis family, protein-glutamate methylesterase/glutaminase
LKPLCLVVIGASAGGIEALREVLGGLSRNLPAAVLIVLHTSSTGDGLLPQIVGRMTTLPIRSPHDGEAMEAGHIYLAPANFHMTVEDGRLRILQGPRENLNRPAIDPLFRTAVRFYGAQVVGLILSGLLDDGALGLMVVRSSGGQAIVQDPQTALFPGMPRSALAQVPDALVLPLSEIAPAIERLARGDRCARPAQTATPASQAEVAGEPRRGHPSAFACPDCGGVLWEMEDNGFLHFRCGVGHAFTPGHLDAQQRGALEGALWSALRALEESASLYRRMAYRALDASRNASGTAFSARADNTERNAQVLKEFLLQVNREVNGRAGSSLNVPQAEV